MANDSKAVKKSESYLPSLGDALMAMSGVHGALVRSQMHDKLQADRKREIDLLGEVITGLESHLDEAEQKHRKIEVRGNTVYYAIDGYEYRISVEIQGVAEEQPESQASCLMNRKAGL